MINRISEIPFWGPEEQIRKFINQHDEPSKIPEGETQQSITQMRIANLDEIFQKQILWSYDKIGVQAADAYFYWDWCPIGDGSSENPKWQISAPRDSQENLTRNIDRTFNWRDFQGYTNHLGDESGDEMPVPYDSENDEHAQEEDKDELTNLDIDALRHNVMKSYVEVSEYLGEEATDYGSHNGYVSRKMSLAWLFNAIRALINWKGDNNEKWAEVDIHPLVVDDVDNGIYERFLDGEEQSTQGIRYEDELDLDQSGGRCAVQPMARAKNPNVNGVLKVRGNEFHYGERADFYTHNSFIGECRFFHNARFLGQTTFDKEINGTALRSRWADLAEYREADKAYEPGTLVMFGGEKEITLSKKGVCNAIVTTKPGLILNGDEPSKDCIMVGIALTGTVPVKIVGKVKKFDRLVASSTYPGYARAKKWYDFFKKPIAVALEDSEAFGDFVNCITRMEF